MKNVELRWYIVHVYSGFENKVKASLEERISASPNPDKFGEVLVPTEEVVRAGQRQAPHVGSKILSRLHSGSHEIG